MNLPEISDLFKSLERGSDISIAHNLRSFAGILSGPEDLLISKEFMAFEYISFCHLDLR